MALILTYNEYIHSSQWAALRREALERDKFCRWCGSTQNLEGHHVKYLPRWYEGYRLVSDWEKDKLGNIATFCHDHHWIITDVNRRC